jgi:hypothetical protein
VKKPPLASTAAKNAATSPRAKKAVDATKKWLLKCTPTATKAATEHCNETCGA